MNNFDEITKDFVKWLDTLDEDSIIRIQQKEIERLHQCIKDDKENADEIISEQDKEIERLTELCNKYEEEHKTTFETWQKDIKENELLHSIIKETREYLELFNDNSSLIDHSIIKGALNLLDKVKEK